VGLNDELVGIKAQVLTDFVVELTSPMKDDKYPI